MYIDRNILQEYPFTGEFYRVTVDNSLPPSQWEETEDVIFTTSCDIQESSKSKSSADGFISASYEVYFPFKKEDGIVIQKGDLFRSDMYGMSINGEVIGIAASQLGGCMVTIKDLD